MTPDLPPESTPAAPADDSIGRGVLYAFLWQLGALALSAPLFFTVWGLIQWFALIPLYISWRRRGYRLAAKGALITGLVGLLVNCTCAALIIPGLSFH